MAFNANENNKHNHPDVTYLFTILLNKTYKKNVKNILFKHKQSISTFYS